MKCKYKKGCPHYKDNSYTCNRGDKEYCGYYIQQEEEQKKVQLNSNNEKGG